MMPFKVGDRVGYKYRNDLKGVVTGVDGILCNVKWDNDKISAGHYYRMLRLLDPNEDGAIPGSSTLTINEQAHGHE